MFAILIPFTANSAAFLVLDRPEREIRGIDDPRLRNPSHMFTFATVRNSDVELYFKRNVELAAMYRAMQQYNYESVEAAIQAVRNGSINAFIWEASRLQYEAYNYCDLTVTPDAFGKSQYAIAVRQKLKQYGYYDWYSTVKQLETNDDKNVTSSLVHIKSVTVTLLLNTNTVMTT